MLGTAGKQEQAVTEIRPSLRAGIAMEVLSRPGRQAGWFGSAVSFRRAQSVPGTSQEFLTDSSGGLRKWSQ